MQKEESGGRAMVEKTLRESTPLGFPRAIGFGISIGVNRFLNSLGLELNFIYILWGLALFSVCVESKNFILQFDRFLRAFPREVCLLLEWAGYVQEVVYTFIMTNIGIWITVMYSDASRPKPGIYAIVFVVTIGIVLFEHKYPERSFFLVGRKGEKARRTGLMY